MNPLRRGGGVKVLIAVDDSTFSSDIAGRLSRSFAPIILHTKEDSHLRSVRNLSG